MKYVLSAALIMFLCINTFAECRVAWSTIYNSSYTGCGAGNNITKRETRDLDWYGPDSTVKNGHEGIGWGKCGPGLQCDPVFETPFSSATGRARSLGVAGLIFN